MDQKFRFKLNLFDGIVLVLALAVAAFLAYTALKPAAPVEDTSAPAASSVVYTVRFNKMMEGTETLVEPGDELMDAIKNYKLGTVLSAEAVPATTRVVDEVNRKVVRAEIPGYVDMLVTVRSDACTMGESSLILDGGFVLRTNITAYIKGEGYMASGPIINIEREGLA